MPKVDYVEETSVRKALAFEIEAELVDGEIEARAKQYARKLKIPGFRPGKIPPAVIKQRFRQQVLEEAAEALVNRFVHEELEGRGLRPLAVPRVTDLKIEENQPLTFRAVFETLPLVELPEYKGLQAKARRASVGEEDLARELERLREEAARFDPVEGRPSQAGDFVLVDLLWKPADGGKGGRDENALIEVGGEGNHAELNQALTGMAPGETRQARASYAEDHHSRALAGRTLEYTLTLKAVKQKVLPALDDEFAKDLGDWDSLEALKATLRERLLLADERRAERELKQALVAQLVQRASFEVPDALVERHMLARTENAARGLAAAGIDPSRAGVDWQKYRDAQREESVGSAKADILLDEIARREGIEVLEPELEAEIARYAERVRKPREVVRAQLEKEGELAALRARLREEKTLDLLKANARLDFE
jgi:trigger factor